jgi:hypothetical protein
MQCHSPFFNEVTTMNRLKMFFFAISILLFLYLSITGNAQASISYPLETSSLEPIATSIATDLGTILGFAFAIYAAVTGAKIGIKIVKKMTTLST